MSNPWIPINLPWRVRVEPAHVSRDLPDVEYFPKLKAAEEAAEIAEARLCFSKGPYCVPGVRVRFAGWARPLVLGDLNMLGGACDDCRQIDDDDIVEAVQLPRYED